MINVPNASQILYWISTAINQCRNYVSRNIVDIGHRVVVVKSSANNMAKQPRESHVHANLSAEIAVVSSLHSRNPDTQTRAGSAPLITADHVEKPTRPPRRADILRAQQQVSETISAPPRAATRRLNNVETPPIPVSKQDANLIVQHIKQPPLATIPEVEHLSTRSEILPSEANG